MALLGRAPLHLDAAEVLHCKKNFTAPTGPAAPGTEGGFPSFIRAARQQLSKEGAKKRTLRADTAKRPPSPMPPPPLGPIGGTV